MYVLLVYLISALSWGAVLFNLSKVIIATIKNKTDRPSLLIPLTIASLALFLESVYFGIMAFFHLSGYTDISMMMIQEENWFLIKVLIAVSGVLLLLNLKIDK